jgi:aminoglycoside phosphotransferase (APT) family kinase protein
MPTSAGLGNLYNLSNVHDKLPNIPLQAILQLLDSINIPRPASVRRWSTEGEYHSIWLLVYPNSPARDLVLRISGTHLPRIKTENEVAIMTWVAQNTKIPIPQVVRYDSSTNNPIRHEYTIITRAPGNTLDAEWPHSNQDQRNAVLDSLADYLAELHKVEWQHIGGLRFQNDAIVPGPVLEESFWQVPDIARLWPRETIESLNISGPFSSYVEYITAHMQKYSYAIRRHEAFGSMHYLLPRIDRFIHAIHRDADALNKVKFRLAHKDLHFSNIMYDRTSHTITGILDWEFSGIVPFPKWDPTRAFLAHAPIDSEAVARKQALVQAFDERCQARGMGWLKDASFVSARQESMQAVADYARSLVEVIPRGEKLGLAVGWRNELEKNLAVFGC